MTNLKILRAHDKVVEYTEQDWATLKEKRNRAKLLLKMFI